MRKLEYSGTWGLARLPAEALAKAGGLGLETDERKPYASTSGSEFPWAGPEAWSLKA
jgi:hypothetical protein